MLRRVLLHRPDLELRRLTPSNCRELLFDDVLWVRRARQEHDAFADALRERGVEVLYVGELLAETVKDEVARAWLLDRAVDERDLGSALAATVRGWMDDLDPDTLARHLIGGLAVAELPHGAGSGLRADWLGARGFVLPPLPNHLFTRDTSCWIRGGVSINPMYWPARRLEAYNVAAIYRYHPMFAGADFEWWYPALGGDGGPLAMALVSTAPRPSDLVAARIIASRTSGSAIFAAHSIAASRDGISKTQKPPLNSLV